MYMLRFGVCEGGFPYVHAWLTRSFVRHHVFFFLLFFLVPVLWNGYTIRLATPPLPRQTYVHTCAESSPTNIALARPMSHQAGKKDFMQGEKAEEKTTGHGGGGGGDKSWLDLLYLVYFALQPPIILCEF